MAKRQKKAALKKLKACKDYNDDEYFDIIETPKKKEIKKKKK
jgi:hypothetical protein